MEPNLRARPDTPDSSPALWVAIGNKDLSFDQREKVLEELKNLSRADMIRFVVNELKPRTAHRLIMHTQGRAITRLLPYNSAKKLAQWKSSNCALKLMMWVRPFRIPQWFATGVDAA